MNTIKLTQTEQQLLLFRMQNVQLMQANVTITNGELRESILKLRLAHGAPEDRFDLQQNDCGEYYFAEKMPMSGAEGSGSEDSLAESQPTVQ